MYYYYEMWEHGKWKIEIRHEGLNKYRHIRGEEKYVVRLRAALQKVVWDSLWESKLKTERNMRERKISLPFKEYAILKTKLAELYLDQLEKILEHALSRNNVPDWSSLLDKTPFPNPRPIKPKLRTPDDEPLKSDPTYELELTLLDRIFPKFRKRKEEEIENRYLSNHEHWVNTKNEIESENASKMANYANVLEQYEKEKK